MYVGGSSSLLDLAIVVVVLEEADDGADAAGAEAVGRVADCYKRDVLVTWIIEMGIKIIGGLHDLP
jgi:hypothetical protein